MGVSEGGEGSVALVQGSGVEGRGLQSIASDVNELSGFKQNGTKCHLLSQFKTVFPVAQRHVSLTGD